MNWPFYREIWCVDFEFGGGDGDRPSPVCLVARELRSNRIVRLWRDEFGPVPPYPISADVLFVAYYASAELGCHRVLGWPMPARILDLCAEFKLATNGLEAFAGRGLLGALAYYGLDSMGATEKDEMRNLAQRGGPWSTEERNALLDYCQEDVDALARLLPAMNIDLPHALYRGRYMAASSAMEHYGIPIDVPTLRRVIESWEAIKLQLIAEVDRDFGVFDGTSFREDRFEQYLTRTNTPWPRRPDGRFNLDAETFRQVSNYIPSIQELADLRNSISKLRLNDLTVGKDGRNRTLLSAFASKTSRNQPSNSKYIFGLSRWMRGLIKPPAGYGLAYIDWSQQEFGIAAALSGDPNMIAAYQSGDPYLAFAKQAGAVPLDANKQSHGPERERFKQCVLGLSYGLGADGLAARIGGPPVIARELLQAHKETYRVFWAWLERVVNHALVTRSTPTVFDWRLQVHDEAKIRTLQNYPMQANGAEMLRLACCYGTECGIEVVAPVHDAVMIVAPLDRLEQDVDRMQDFMRKASREVLAGFELSSEAKIVKHPNRYMDDRGQGMWDRVMALLDAIEERKRA